MAQKVALYTILRSYAKKNNSPFIDIKEVVDYLERYAKHKAPEQSEWSVWAENTAPQFWLELSPLAEEGRVMLLTDTEDGRIYLPSFYNDLIRDAWQTLDETAREPFPGEETLKIKLPADPSELAAAALPADYIAYTLVEGGLDHYFTDAKKPDADGIPGEESQGPGIIKLIFPDGLGTALLLPDMIPRKLLEGALLKVRYFLGKGGNKEYVLHKIAPQLQNNDRHLRDLLEQIIIRPLDCVGVMESYGEFQYLFWVCFCSLVKNDIKKKNEKLGEDISAFQAACVIEQCNAQYKARAVKVREKELAFKALEIRMEKNPFYFTIDDIIKSTNDKGVLLLTLYDEKELQNYIKSHTTDGGENKLPPWLILSGGGEHWYVLKSRYLPLFSRLINEIKPKAKQFVSKRWTGMLGNFLDEQAMEKDAAFDTLLTGFAADSGPVLAALLEDPKLVWVYEEMDRDNETIPPNYRFFGRNGLLPMSSILGLSRKDMLADAKLTLPFWHLIPFLRAIAAFFARRRKKKKDRKVRKDVEKATIIAVEDDAKTSSRAHEIRSSAQRLEEKLVPADHSLETYLDKLEGEWVLLLGKQAREDLVEDVRSLVRDYLRRTMRMHKRDIITEAKLREMAATLLSRTTSLSEIKNKEALQLYMQLYLLKLVRTYKF